MRKKVKTVLLAAVVLFLAGHLGMADPVFVDSADFTGSRSTGGGGLVGTANWDNGNFTLSWQITDNLDGTFTYNYIISGEGERHKNLSHWILELSQGPDWSGVFANITGPVEVKTHSQDAGNPGLPGSVYGVKFDFRGLDITFTTSQAPVWGDFYAKDGKTGGPGGGSDIIAYNANFGKDPANYTDFTGFIARPDGERTAVPEPGTLVLLGSGLLLSGLLRKRSR
ncbi:MAG TPA: PEP-CTERM sorting domain-containing protein [Acidobacteriota bacterium]|nr:PEP-CTERM sorting domain-containing protein [Acidobacteriota bacterium]